MKTRSLLALSILMASTAWAQQYRWVDDKGRIHYTDTPPPASAKSAERKNLRGNTVGGQESYELTQAIQKSPVTLYTHADCKDLCQMARDVLNKRGVPFREVAVTNAEQFQELKRVSGGEGVPVMIVGGYVEKTPSASAFNAALDSGGYPPPGVARPGNQTAPPPPPPPPAKK